uniref:FYVE-type domain-containing protein n=1 Tax=Phytophthora ramorum TaxID=164328 RepID=H3GNF7_PHYRM
MQQLQTARQRFVPDSEDEGAAPLRFVTLPPKLVTSKSEGQQANARRRHLQQQGLHSQVQVRGHQAEAPGGTYLRRENEVRRPFGADAEHNKSFESLSSVSPCAGDAAAALEQGLMSSTTFSSSAVLTDDMLAAVARKGKQKLEMMAKRQVMMGRWKRMPHSKPDCQMFESVSKAKDQYSVVAKMDLPCSLREIMSVFSTDNDADFHRSMEAVFGDQYVYGVNVRTMECASFAGGGSTALRARAQARRASEPATRRASEGSTMPPLRSAKLKLNAVSLMQKQRLVWKQRNMTFLDFLEEKIEAKSVTRVMQTMDMTDEDLEFSSVTLSSPTTTSSHENCCHEPTQHGIDPQYELKGIFAGYVIQEDSEEKFTRLFFYATHHHHLSGPHGQTRMPRSGVQLLRAMVNKVCLLETVVLRRRLGYYPLARLPTSTDEATMATYCATCYIPFGLLRKKYFCRLCGHYTCRKCSNLRDVEKKISLVEKHRVCVSCVRRVSYCVFSTCAFPPKMESNVSGSSWTSDLSQQPTEVAGEGEDDYDPPIMDDLASKDIEDGEAVQPNQSAGGALAGFVSDLLHGKEKKQEPAVDRRPRLQLTIDDLSTWVPGPLLDGQNTPKESISLLDSFCTSHSSTSSRSRDLTSWLSPSPTGA